MNKLLQTFYIYTQYLYHVEICEEAFCPMFVYSKCDRFVCFVALNCVTFGKQNSNKGYDNSQKCVSFNKSLDSIKNKI